MSTVKVARVYEYTVKLIHPGFGPVSGLVEEFVKVDFEGELETIVDLRSRVRITLIMGCKQCVP